jgi:hypothetical protein
MLNFCTLFDSNFLAVGIAMYESLEKHCYDFHLYVYAFDENCHEILSIMALDNMTVVSLAEFEDEELLRIKPTRTVREYCWTCASSTILYSIKNFGLDKCTYLDADLYFYDSPAVLIDEMKSNSVMLTEHRYLPGSDLLLNGKYCVQFAVFCNDHDGMNALIWWREKCLEWCYARYEEGRFGDQKYLDDWMTRFRGVCELQHLGGGVAPWNLQQYRISQDGDRYSGTEKTTGKRFRLIFYHFHYLRFHRGGIIKLTSTYLLSRSIRQILYKPYIKHLHKIKERILEIDGAIDPLGTTDTSERPLSAYGLLCRLVRTRFRIISLLNYVNMHHYYKVKNFR